MGKVRRLRQKYHQLVKTEGVKKAEGAGDNEAKGLSYEEIVSGNFDKVHVPSAAGATQGDFSNVFSSLNIDVAKLNKLNLNQDDNVSVRSIARSLRVDATGRLLKKEETRKLRRELFLQKINIIEQTRNNEKRKNKKKKKKKGNNKDTSVNNIKDLQDELPQLVKTEGYNKQMSKPMKKKGIEKAKKRQKNMLEDISAFRQLLVDPQFKSNPLKTISDKLSQQVIIVIERPTKWLPKYITEIQEQVLASYEVGRGQCIRSELTGSEK